VKREKGKRQVLLPIEERALLEGVMKEVREDVKGKGRQVTHDGREKQALNLSRGGGVSGNVSKKKGKLDRTRIGLQQEGVRKRKSGGKSETGLDKGA